MKIKLGDKYRDTLTGFEGTATAKVDYLYGCVRVTLEGPGKEGAPEEYTFDEQRLESAKGSPVRLTATSGGARRTPPRRGLS